MEWTEDLAPDHAIVIPALAESGRLSCTLDDLRTAAQQANAPTLAVVVVNNRPPGHAPESWRQDNQQTLARLRPLVQASRAWPALRLAVVDAASPGLEIGPRDGVGMARKIGLDLALAVLHKAQRPAGALISLDADTRVDPNYLAALRAFFNTPRWGVILPFRHRLPKDTEARDAIIRYELHLLCYALGLARAGSPYGFTTIGSAMACTATAYAAVTGMRRSQAGEDFYFLQQLAKTGPIDLCTATTVRPAARTSSRVPFGTGRAMATPHQGPCVETYAPETYAIIGAWLGAFSPVHSGTTLRERAHPALDEFLCANDFDTAWERIHANSRDTRQNTGQFHRWFDGFRTLKAIHHLRDHGYPNVPIQTTAAELFPGATHETPLEELREIAHTALAHEFLHAPMGLPR